MQSWPMSRKNSLACCRSRASALQPLTCPPPVNTRLHGAVFLSCIGAARPTSTLWCATGLIGFIVERARRFGGHAKEDGYTTSKFLARGDVLLVLASRGRRRGCTEGGILFSFLSETKEDVIYVHDTLNFFHTFVSSPSP